MAENGSDNKQLWLVPIVVAIIGAISTIAVPWISQHLPSQEPRSEAYTLQAADPVGIELPVSKDETITIKAKGEVHTNPNGDVPKCDTPAGPDGLVKCKYSKPGLPFMALIGEFNGIPEFIGSERIKTFDTSGKLLLKVNDWHREDNVGKFEISVTRK